MHLIQTSEEFLTQGVTNTQNLRTGKCLAWKDSWWLLSLPIKVPSSLQPLLEHPQGQWALSLQFGAASARMGQLLTGGMSELSALCLLVAS